jgi:hypothetical protein
VRPADEPRLLNIEDAARYLGGVSTWTLRALVAKGHLPRIVLPSVRHLGNDGRRLLFDRHDLDVFIESRRRA